jgi:hypothetical protein
MKASRLLLSMLVLVVIATIIGLGAQAVRQTAANGVDNSITSPAEMPVIGFTSLELDGSGNPVVAYTGVRVLHCGNPNCTSANSIANLGYSGENPSLALDASGNPVVSFHDDSNEDLRVIHCGNPNCTLGNVVAIPDSVGDVGSHSSLVLDASGNPVISYTDSSNLTLKILHCGNPNCTAGNNITSPLTPSEPFTHGAHSLILDAQGNPVVSYAVNSIGWPLGLRVLHCNDVNCSGGDESLTLPDNALSGNYSSISLDSGGNPVISYAGSSGRLSVLHCDDPNCAGDESGHIAQPDSGDIGGWFTSLALDAIGRPIVSYYDYPNHDLRILRCNDPNCVAGGDLVSSPDTGGHVGTFSSLELDPSGNPVVSYVDDTDTNKYLKILHCSVPTCILDTDSDHCPEPGHLRTANSTR